MAGRGLAETDEGATGQFGADTAQQFGLRQQPRTVFRNHFVARAVFAFFDRADDERVAPLAACAGSASDVDRV